MFMFKNSLFILIIISTRDFILICFFLHYVYLIYIYKYSNVCIIFIVLVKNVFFLNPKYNLIYNFFMKNKDKHFNK